MNKRKLLFLVAGIPVLLIVVWLAKLLLFPPTENQKIEQMIRKAAAAFESKSSKSVGTFLTDDFVIQRYGDRDTLLNHLKVFFFQARDLSVSIEYLKHEAEKLPRTASETRVLVVAKVSGMVDGQQFQAFSGKGVDAIALTIRKIQNEWFVASAMTVDTSDPAKAFEQMLK